MKALSPPGVREPVVESRTPAEEPARSAPPRRYAAIVARTPEGLPAKIQLPGPPAAKVVGLYGKLPSGYSTWLADIQPDGTVKSDGTRNDALALLGPGSTLVAATDPRGRVLSVGSIPGVRPAASKGKVRTRSAAGGSESARYEVDPNELLISGTAGRVIRVR
jgi:hypothetical protein